MGQFDWLGQVPPPPKEKVGASSVKLLEVPKGETKPQPQYEDKGVAYRGYSKKQIADGQYSLAPQGTRFFSTKINNTAGFDNLVSRTNASTKIYYATTIIVEWSIASGIFPFYVILADYENGVAKTRYITYIFSTGQNRAVIDLTSCPREFRGTDFVITTQSTLGASDHIHFLVYGFEEDK